jgi:RecB family exonuclease
LKKLDDAGQPYELKGALGFYERPEIRDLVAYLRLLGDPADKIALARLLTRPPLPAKADEVLPQIAGWAEPLRALLQVENYARWAATVLDLSALVTRIGVDELFFELMERTRHLDALRPTAGAQWERLLANTSRFSELIAEFCERSRDHSLSGFLTYLDLVLLSGVDEEVAEPERPVRDAVQVMTIHQAKGLEFEAVFIPALVEGRLPQSIWRDALELPAAVLEPSVRAREDHIAEERRLLYVAMTRARSRLYLSWARRYEGSRTWRPSRFLEEVRSGAAATDVERPTNVVTLSTPTDDQHANGRAKLPPPRVELSFSSAAAYRECPRQYWYRYAARLPALQPLEGRYGSAVHAALMGAGAARREGRLLTREVLEPLYSRAWEGAGITDARRGPVLRQLGWDQLVRYVEGGGLAVAPRLVEQPFTADLDGWRLRGIIDRVDPPPTQRGGEVGLEGREKNRDEDHGGAWRLVDYKTGNPMPASRLRRDFQLALYALGAKHGLGLEPLELEIVYLKTGQSVVMAADEALLSEARRVADEVVDGIRQQRFEARPERRRCQLCPYRLACPDAL